MRRFPSILVYHNAIVLFPSRIEFRIHNTYRKYTVLQMEIINKPAVCVNYATLRFRNKYPLFSTELH